MTDKKGDKTNVVQYQSVAASRKLDLARIMLLRGFTTRFVEIETSLSKKTLRKLRGELGLSLEDRKGKIQKNVQTIIKNSTERKIAALFIFPYAALNGKKCGDFDVRDVIDAYDLYRASINWNYNQADKLPRILTINEAYSLAIAYINREISLEVCPDCGTPFVVFYNTSVTSSSCPNDIARKRQHNTALDERIPAWPRMKKGPIHAPALSNLMAM
jgi:hypothetical protein